MASDIFSTSPEPAPRFRSLELSAIASLDGHALGRAMSRSRATGPDWGPDSVNLFGSDLDASDDSWVRYKWRLWWAPPALWRDDLMWPNGETTVIIVRPDASLAYVSMHQTLYTSEQTAATARERVLHRAAIQMPTIANRGAEFPLLRPRLPAVAWELVTVGDTEHIGRVARRVRATRRAAMSDRGDRSGYWQGIDEYECLVDDELQILLSLKGILEGSAVAEISVEHVRADASLPVETFTFVPPAGTRVARVPGKK